MDTLFIVSSYLNNLEWLNNYPNQKIIYDKSNSLPKAENIIHVPNVGHNIFDQMDFIISNYNNLPEYIAFIQGWSYDHCKKEKFDKLINNKYFTPLESYEHIPESYAHRKSKDMQYEEINTSWYLYLEKPYEHRYFNSYDEFMNMFFCNYQHLEWIRFSPGAMYIVPKNNILYYSKEFYEKLITLVNYAQYTMEAHLLERAMYYIYSNKYKERKIDNE